MARAIGLQPPNDRQTAERPPPQCRVGIEVVDVGGSVRGTRPHQPNPPAFPDDLESSAAGVMLSSILIATLESRSREPGCVVSSRRCRMVRQQFYGAYRGAG